MRDPRSDWEREAGSWKLGAGSWKLEAGLFHSMFRQVIAQGSLADAHHLGGVLLDPSGAAERAPDCLALGPIKVLAEVQRWQAGGRGGVHPHDADDVGADDGSR